MNEKMKKYRKCPALGRTNNTAGLNRLMFMNVSERTPDDRMVVGGEGLLGLL